MKLITRDTDYAIRALCSMAQSKDQVVSVAHLVEKLGIPGPFLRKLLQLLNKNRILESRKGTGGGFSLQKPPDKIFLVELMRIFQGSFSLNECSFKKSRCPNMDTCLLRKRIRKIEERVFAEIGPISIASLSKVKRSHG